MLLKMILNIILLGITTIILYFGYTYKGVILLITTLLFDEFCKLIYNYKINKTSLNKNNSAYSMVFKHNDIEYNLIIPENSTIPKMPKVMALDGCVNKTHILLRSMGPNLNFFGYTITPKNIGCETLLIWINKVRYAFEKNDVIVFDEESKSRILNFENNSDQSTSEEDN